MSLYFNNLETSVASNKLCKAFGIKVSTNAQVVQLAANAHFDSLFIDLEHAWLSLNEARNLCHVGLLAGITPFVRVPTSAGMVLSNVFSMAVLWALSFHIYIQRVSKDPWQPEPSLCLNNFIYPY